MPTPTATSETQRRRSALSASSSSRVVSGAFSLSGSGSMMGGVPGIATPLDDDDGAANGTVFGPVEELDDVLEIGFDPGGVDGFDPGGVDGLGETDGTPAAGRGAESDRSPPMSIGVAAPVRFASLEMPGCEPALGSGTVRFESSCDDGLFESRRGWLFGVPLF